MALLIVLAIIFAFIIYLLVDLFQLGNINTFFDKWLRKIMWLWLPFYALWRLVKEIIFKRK